MTAIREATGEDAPRIVAMCEAFLASTPYGKILPATRVGIEEMVLAVLEGGADGESAVCYVAEVEGRLIGMIAGTLSRHRLNGLVLCEELVWWVEPTERHRAAGIQLLAYLERWAGTNGASVLKMVAPAASTVGHFLTSWGFEALEAHFIKRI